MMSSDRLGRIGALTEKVLSLACVILYFSNKGGVRRSFRVRRYYCIVKSLKFISWKIATSFNIALSHFRIPDGGDQIFVLVFK